MPFVLDCSTTMTWVFADEQSETTDAIRDSLLHDHALAPALWPIEVANVLLAATRRGRLDRKDWIQVTSQLISLPINIDTASVETIFQQALPLAEEHTLSVYDAMYLELALRTGLPLATNDKALAHAARSNAINVL